jgi:hypothetical protein
MLIPTEQKVLKAAIIYLILSPDSHIQFANITLFNVFSGLNQAHRLEIFHLKTIVLG